MCEFIAAAGGVLKLVVTPFRCTTYLPATDHLQGRELNHWVPSNSSLHTIFHLEQICPVHSSRIDDEHRNYGEQKRRRIGGRISSSTTSHVLMYNRDGRPLPTGLPGLKSYRRIAAGDDLHAGKPQRSQSLCVIETEVGMFSLSKSNLQRLRHTRVTFAILSKSSCPVPARNLCSTSGRVIWGGGSSTILRRE